MRVDLSVCWCGREWGWRSYRRLVRETVGGGVPVERHWNSLKYDRNMLTVVEGDMDVRMMFQKNDELGYRDGRGAG